MKALRYTEADEARTKRVKETIRGFGRMSKGELEVVICNAEVRATLALPKEGKEMSRACRIKLNFFRAASYQRMLLGDGKCI